LFTSFEVLTHAPSQSVPFSHTHAPPSQAIPASTEQTLPHPPQLLGSLDVMAHVLPQSWLPAGHAQLPEMHVSGETHAVLQDPQCSFVCKLTQVPAQLVSPAVVHTHALFWQCVSVGHAFPHLPQLLLSPVRVVQVPVPVQYVSPATGQVQPPPEHTSLRGHVRPQASQFKAFVFKSTQTFEQIVSPESTAHSQSPPEQCVPAGHAVPQLPQLDESLLVSVHTLLQIFGSLPVVQTQVPLTQVSPVAHLFPHWPQFDGSDCVTAQ
jgi:hypothetical protein